jgi:hypothetical protein
LLAVIFFTIILDFGTGLPVVLRRVYSHAGVFVIIWTDTYLVKHKYKGHGILDPARQRKKALMQSLVPVAAGIIYLTWNMIAHEFNHVYPYAFQAKLSATVAPFVYSALLLFIWSLFWFGRWVNQKIHAPQHRGNGPLVPAETGPQ